MDKTKDYEIKLIIEVERHKCLYDKTSATYKNRNMKKRSWAEISTILGRPIAECQRKWTNLRDSFWQYFKAENMAKSGGSSAKKKVKWIHYETLKFLVPCTKTKPSTLTNLKYECSPSEEITIESMVSIPYNQDDLSIFNQTIPQTSLSNGENWRRSKRNKWGGEDNEKEPSAIATFFMSLAQQAEDLSRPQQLLLQKKCLQALEDVEMKFDYS